MTNQLRRLQLHIRTRMESQRGAVMILMAVGLITLMGMAVFAVDYGWIAYNRLEARKAAESAALAGVVYMPLSGTATLAPGEPAYDTALDIAGRAGYTGGTGTSVVPAETASPNQLRVTVTDQIDTFFMRAFRPSPITISGTAVAEQLPPLKLGSDDAQLGGNGGADQLWVAINGEARRKQDGDPFSTRCGYTSCSGSPNVGSGDLEQFRDPAYYYAVDIPEGQTGAIVVGIYDGTHLPRSAVDVDTGDRAGETSFLMTFELYAPDSTPNNWQDNSAASAPVCSQTFYYDGQGGRAAGFGVNTWVNLSGCPTATSGIYVLEVSVDGNEDAISAFAIRASVGGTSNVAVYGLGAMSLWMNKDNSAPVFKIVRVDEIYAGTELQLGLYDPGDATGLSHLLFRGALAGIDCTVRVTDQNGNVGAWTSDGALNPDGNWAGGSCGLTTATNSTSQIYNGDWLEIRFQIPPGHTCSGAACWALVDYNFADSPNDRTTWTAQVNGTPIHLEP
ncbi:MAG: pilus assembly protein TadG-related protein [Acidimicrobiia bacterium]